MSAWGTPVPEDPQPTQASAWGTPVDEGGDAPAKPVQPATPFGSQSSEQIVQDQTGIRPYGSPVANAAAGVGRVLAAPFTGLAAGARALFDTPTIANPEEQTALDNYGSLGLGMHRAFVAPAEAATQTANTLRSQGHPFLAAGAQLGALPILGPLGQSLGQRAAAGDITGAVTEGLATAAGPSAVKEALPSLGGAQSTLRQRLRPATSTDIVPAEEQAGASLAKAINPPGGIPAGLEDSLTAQTPGIKDYAARTNNPLNTRWELAKAALGHAQELNDFYDEHVLGPSKDRPVDMEGTGYQGETRNGKATLGQIDDRLAAINKLMKPAYGKLDTGAGMTAMERLGLDNEAGALRTKLYNELANDTGMTPDAIKKLRTDYGQSYDIAGKTDAARRRVSASGANFPTSKEGLVKSVLEAVQGGHDAIADRGVQSSLQRFKSAVSPIADWKNTATTTRENAAAQAAANQAAAQQEFLHGTGLTQAAQDAAATRAAQASGVRGANVQATRQMPAVASPSNVLPATTKMYGGRTFVQDPRTGWWQPQ